MACLTLHGIGVVRGYAIGRVTRRLQRQPEIIEYELPVPQIELEVQRFRHSLAQVKHELRTVREQIPAPVPVEITAFIDTHLLMLEDSLLAQAPEELIRSHRCNAEWALQLQRNRLVQVFEAMDDPYLRARKDDVDQVIVRLQRVLLAGPDDHAHGFRESLRERIVVADDLAPADLILLQQQGVHGCVTEYGGPLSHTAVLARSLGIPTLVGVHRAQHYLRDDELVVIDGYQGMLLAGLDTALVDHYRHRQRAEQQHRQTLARLRDRPATTRDGVNISLQANIELPGEAAAALTTGADGVGLYRTEFLFMNRTEPPAEEEQLDAYRTVLAALAGRPVTIRTLDLGADKQVDGGRPAGPLGGNPALGLRAIRLCLREQGLFRVQLRALLRASAWGPLRLMIPMLSTLQELAQVRRLLAELRQGLQAEGHVCAAQLPLGGMVEVPAVAICAPLFARQLDFLSIGTNDLIQYTLAIDRIDDTVNYLYDPLHPAVLTLIHGTIEAGRAATIPVSLCGEMAGDPRYTRLLLGLGLTEFSMQPGSLLEVKQVISDSHCAELQRLTRRALACPDPGEQRSLLEHLTCC